MSHEFSHVFVKNTPEVKLPTKGTRYSSGYDIVATSEPEIVGVELGNTGLYKRIDYIQYRTSLFLEPLNSLRVLIYPRSSITKYNLMLKNSIGLCDSDYRGEYLVRFAYLPQPEDMTLLETGGFVLQPNLDRVYKMGDKIGQLVFEKNTEVRLMLVDELLDTVRSAGGFGSTGQ